MKKVTVRNLYGYPSLTERIKEYAKANGFLLIVDHCKLLNPKLKSRLKDDSIKILVENPAICNRDSVPIIGYSSVNGMFHKTELPHPTQLVPNKVSVKVPVTWERLPAKTLEKVTLAERKDKVLATFDKESDEYRITKRMINRFLPPTLLDPFTAPKPMQYKKKAVKPK